MGEYNRVVGGLTIVVADFFGLTILATVGRLFTRDDGLGGDAATGAIVETVVR